MTPMPMTTSGRLKETSFIGIMSKEETFPPLKYIDVARSTHTTSGRVARKNVQMIVGMCLEKFFV